MWESPAGVLVALVGKMEVPAWVPPAQRVMAASGEVALSATDRSSGTRTVGIHAVWSWSV